MVKCGGKSEEEELQKTGSGGKGGASKGRGEGEEVQQEFDLIRLPYIPELIVFNMLQFSPMHIIP
jgi:hypothetical protein